MAYKLEPLAFGVGAAGGLKPAFVPHRGGKRIHLAAADFGEDVSSAASKLGSTLLSSLTFSKFRSGGGAASSAALEAASGGSSPTKKLAAAAAAEDAAAEAAAAAAAGVGGEASGPVAHPLSPEKELGALAGYPPLEAY